MELATVGLEDRLLSREPNMILELRLGDVVHLLDARRMDSAVLDQFLERHPRDLTPKPVERREHDSVWCVVDDEVDPGEMLEGPDVSTLAPDDPALHVVRGQLDHTHRRLGRVACCDALQCIGDECASSTLGVGPGFLVELSHCPCELVPDEIL